MNERPQEPSSDVPVPQSDMSWMQSMIAANRQRQFYAAQRNNISMVVSSPPFIPEILLQAEIILRGDKTQEGVLVKGVAIAWEEIIRWLAQDPNFLFKIGWRELEELIAGAYKREGWSDVILTPRSGDGGRDIIATRSDIGAIRYFDQVKAYQPGHFVTADDVRATFGVLNLHPNTSKALVTTTSKFAPGVFDEFKSVMPNRLELKEGAQLHEWLQQLHRQR